MNLREQLRWGGAWTLITAILMNATNILVYLGQHNATIQAVYAIGFTGLILACTFIHMAQARQAGLLGVIAYLVSVFSLAFANVATFLSLARLSGINEAQQALMGIWDPVMRFTAYGVFVGFILQGISIAMAGVFPRWAGILITLGAALQLPSQFAMDIAEPLLVLFTVGGSILFCAGLIWVGWSPWPQNGLAHVEPGLSNLDRAWGGPVVILAAIILTVNAYLNSLGQLTLASGISNLLAFAFLIPTLVIMHTAQADRAGWIGTAGFVIAHLGTTLYIIPAYFIMAQLAGQIENNRVLMASWVDIPIGRYASYMILLGIFLFGIAVIRADVFPRWTGWLIAIGLAILIPSQFSPQAYLFTIFWVIGAILQGIGIGWIGWSLIRSRAASQMVQLNESTT